LHIICAHPSFLSIGILHFGHHLMLSSKSPHGKVFDTSPSPPCLTRIASYSWQDRPSCQLAEHKLQNTLTQIGQVTATPWYLLPRQMWQMVWQPDVGHQVRAVSRDTSAVNTSFDLVNFTDHYQYSGGKFCVYLAAPCQSESPSGFDLKHSRQSIYQVKLRVRFVT
jgi:hypothetical protein